MSITLAAVSQAGPFLRQLQPYLQHYGYWALFFGLLLEDFGLPVPGEILLIASAVWASLGHFNIWLVVSIGLVAAVIGDNIGYAIGLYGGRRLVLRYGHYVFLTQKRLLAMEGLIRRHGGKIIVVARFLEGLRQFNGLIAGTLEYPWARFLIFNISGALLWVGFWGALAYFEGEQLASFYQRFHQWTLIGLIAGLVLAAAAIVYRLVRKWRHAGR